ncbi:MAG: hypothetical protein KatS3mg105_1818 [Gemmatales bacterium]|nr:MAG: hypothetical protein KatS3mg105_1818 [Gemmatales bacterium]
MSEIASASTMWLVHSAAGGGLLLLISWFWLSATRQPARKQRLGEIGVASALLLAVLCLAPSWWYLPSHFALESQNPSKPPKAIESEASARSESVVRIYLEPSLRLEASAEPPPFVGRPKADRSKYRALAKRQRNTVGGSRR